MVARAETLALIARAGPSPEVAHKVTMLALAGIQPRKLKQILKQVQVNPQQEQELQQLSGHCTTAPNRTSLGLANYFADQPPPENARLYEKGGDAQKRRYLQMALKITI